MTIVQLVGYTTGLVFIRYTTGMTSPGVSAQYRGTDSTVVGGRRDEVSQVVRRDAQYHPYPPAQHGRDLRGSAVSPWRCASGRPSGGGAVLVIEPFVALLVSFASMWLMRYVDARFSVLLMLSSGLMALTFYVQSFFVVRELVALRRADRG